MKKYPWVEIGKDWITIHVDKNYPYDIEADRMKTESDILDWIMHISEKTWSNNTLLGDLILAMIEVAGDFRKKVKK